MSALIGKLKYSPIPVPAQFLAGLKLIFKIIRHLIGKITIIVLPSLSFCVQCCESKFNYSNLKEMFQQIHRGAPID